MKNNTKQTLKIYWQHAVKYPWLFLICIIADILASLSTVIIPLYFREFFDVLSIGAKNASAVNELIRILVFIGLFLFLEFFFWRIAAGEHSAETKVMANLSRTCFNYIISILCLF